MYNSTYAQSLNAKGEMSEKAWQNRKCPHLSGPSELVGDQSNDSRPMYLRSA